MTRLCTFGAPSICHQVYRELMRNTLLDLTPIILTTACHQRNYVETYSRFRVHPDLWYWPSRSNEQIFYGKKRSPLASKGHQMPYHVKKQYVLQEGAWVVPNGVRGCATISTLFPTAFSLSNSLRMPQL